MSYEATAHTAQMSIMNHLLHVKAAPYSDMQKQTGLSSDHFNFHIKQLIGADYVIKTYEGLYTLTRVGKEYANRMDTDERIIEKQPKLSVALIIENDRHEFLAQQRLKQPYYGFWGRPTGKIRWGETVIGAAERELSEETGLTADLAWKGIYHKMDFNKADGSLLEDKYFYIVHCKNPKGTVIADFEGGRNQWMPDTELLAQETVFESITEITDMAHGSNFGVMEVSHEYEPDQY